MLHQLLAVLSALSLLALPAVDTPAQTAPKDTYCYDMETSVRVLKDGDVLNLPLQEYLIGVVLQEMPASFELEALKAQAVAARTFTVHSMYEEDRHEDADICSESSCCQCYLNEDEAREIYANGYDDAYLRVKSAVEETDGQVLTYEDDLIVAAYFSAADTRTESAASVWGANIAYLSSVTSPEEVRITEQTVSEEDFRAAFSDAALDENPAAWFGDVEYTDGGGVASIEIGSLSYDGTTVRSRLGLRSTHFTPVITEDGIVFEVRGSGHGVGMSQYGANTMAAAGESYDGILAHYYAGAVLQRLY